MKKITLFVVALLTTTFAMAQLNPMQPIPADKDVRAGKLENGMTYYIRHNEKPKGQADFWIRFSVGAIQENDAQQGLAHFLEHMAFNGTKNLPGKTIIEYLETIGVKFGNNLNANTAWDVTNYLMTDVPTAREGVIDTALLILHDWSHFISLEPDEVDSERGVISEELRTTDGANWRSTMALIESIGKGTLYEKRNLIGHLEGLSSFKHSEIVDFYAKWYRPEHQAIAIVGDVDVDAVEAKIKALMSDIPAAPADATPKEVIKVPDNEEPIITIFTDPEMQNSRIQFFIKRPALPLQHNNLVYGEMFNTINAYMTTMENTRLEEISMKPDAPFLYAGMGSGSVGIIPTLNAITVMAVTQDGKLTEGFEAIYAEMEKVRRFGFTQSEFERAQNDLMRSAERAYTNRNDRRNGEYVRYYLNNFTQNTPMPDAQTEWELDSMLIKSIDVATVNAMAQQLIYPQNQVVIVAAPQKEGVVVPTAEEFLAIREKVTAMELAAYEDTSVKEPLIAEDVVLKGSPVEKTVEDAAYGTTEWTLANGVKIIVKPTTFKADEVRMSVTAQGGTSVLTDAEFYMGEMMPAFNSYSGVGKFSSTELRKQLSGKTATVMTNVDNYTSEMRGFGSPKDIETMLQLLYLNFMQPRFDQNDYDTLMKMLRSQLENARLNPDYIAQEKTIDTRYGNNPRRHMISLELVDQFDFAQLPAIYDKLFPGADGFTFTFVGNVDLATLKPLVEKYIGSIRTTGTPLTYVDDKVAVVKGEVSEDFTTAMQQPKVQVNYYFSGDMDNTLKNRTTLSFLYQILSTRYLVSIREEKGGTYGVRVMPEMNYLPTSTYGLTIMFDTNEQMADELREIVMQEIRNIAENGPTTEDVEKVREFMLKDWTNGLEINDVWMTYILRKHNEGLDYIADQEQNLKTLSNADIQEFAAKMLANGNLVKVIMRPEAAAEVAQ